MNKNQARRIAAESLEQDKQYLLKTPIGDVLATLTDKTNLKFKIVRGVLTSNRDAKKKWRPGDFFYAPLNAQYYEPTA
jgi:hypothetical protein